MNVFFFDWAFHFSSSEGTVVTHPAKPAKAPHKADFHPSEISNGAIIL